MHNQGRSTQLVIFGASGDLTRRKLMPALAGLEAEGLLGESVIVVGVSRSPKTDTEFREELAKEMPRALGAGFERLAQRVFYHGADVTAPAHIGALVDRLDTLPGGTTCGRLFYLALKPDLFKATLSALSERGLLAMHEREPVRWRRVVIEKPFGRDLASARDLNAYLHAHLQESQIYRIDHYLGKETVQNLLGLRFHNTLFEPLWNRHHVELVQITVAETIGVENGRAGFYDGSGAMRDVVQNHVLQLLALVAMEAPATLEGDDIRNQKVQVLRCLHCPDINDVVAQSVRARYAAGVVDGREVVGYLDEAGVPSDSTTETYVALRAEVDNWRWSGVPFLLRHGKRLKKKFTEIRVQFRNPPIQLFNRPEGLSDAEFRRKLRDGSLCQIRPNALTISIQPHEGLSLSFGVKRPGASMVMTPAQLSFSYEDHFHRASPPAYERLLLDALIGDPTLFLRADEIDASWRYTDEVIRGWSDPDTSRLLEYPAGSWGPDEAQSLFAGCEGSWSRG